ncbi:MAG: NADP-dependent malic enzyme [Holosporales bacterium]
MKELYEAALEYHRSPKPGKLAIQATKPLGNQRDLSLAYSPGVAAPCQEIVQNPQHAAQYTNRSNLVAVITNGTAVLGLGNIGPLASKPVMEGKAVLFKKFAGIDVFDLEINEEDPAKLVDIIASLEPTFGAINLEDIKAPECFEIEEKLKKRLKIPVFHDDQHGTAIIVAAAVLNGLELVGKKIEEVRLVTSGAGAAALACLDQLVKLGLPRANIYVTDLEGVVYEGRTTLMDPLKATYAQKTQARTLDEVIEGADIFLGLSAGDILTPAMITKMAKSPLIFALANPMPEIDPSLARQTRPDAIVATGRSDVPNQVNNVLCFPFIFRGALDVGATEINDAMKMACVRALASLAKAEASDVVAGAYGTEDMSFGPNYIIPKPFDPRLMIEIAPAVAHAAMESGVATRPIEDLEHYRMHLMQQVFRSGFAMRPVLASAKKDPKRVVYSEGEDERVMRAVQVVVDEGVARPILIGRPNVVEMRIQKLGLRLQSGRDYDLVDPQNDPRYTDYWHTYHALMERKGVTPDFAKTIVRTNTTVIGALMLIKNDADALLSGPLGRYNRQLTAIQQIVGLREGTSVAAGLNALVLDSGVIFIADTHVNETPTPEQLAEITIHAAEQVAQFGFMPKIAYVSHSNFGSSCNESALRMQKAIEMVRHQAPHLEIEGEMHADAALNEEMRSRIFPNSRLKGQANLLIMPSLDAANIAFNMVRTLADGQSIGPIVLGLDRAAHILTPSATVRGILNMTAFAVVDAQRHALRPDWNQGVLSL